MTRCDIVQRYDENSDGTIDMDELFNAIDDVGGEITPEELEYVNDAYISGVGGVGQICRSSIPPAALILVGLVILYILTR